MERRKSQRFRVSFTAGYCTPNGTMLSPCRVIEVSRSGSRLELLSGHCIESGSTIELHIDIPGYDKRIIVTFTCTWTRAASDGDDANGYMVGGFFSNVSPEDRRILVDNAEKT